MTTGSRKSHNWGLILKQVKAKSININSELRNLNLEFFFSLEIASKCAVKRFPMLKQPTFLFWTFSMHQMIFYFVLYCIFQNQMDMDKIATLLEMMGPVFWTNFKTMFWEILVQNLWIQMWKQLRQTRKNTGKTAWWWPGSKREGWQQRRNEGPLLSWPHVTELLSSTPLFTCWNQRYILCIYPTIHSMHLSLYMNRS